MPKAFFIDTSRCTACRGCQLACKEWHELPTNQTKQRGTHQNPPDLNPGNYKLVRFSEHMNDEGVVRWNFFPDQCRHCVVPPCKEVADMMLEGAILRDEATGAVLFTEKTKEIGVDDFEAIRGACPYNIPRRDEETGLMSKCTMCFERISSGMLPACVKVCPTGTMNFGDREAMLELANKRLAKVKETFPNAILADPDFTSAIFLLTDAPENYYEYSVASASGLIDRKKFLAGLSKPLRRMFTNLG